MANNQNTATKAVIGKVRFSYVHVFTPHANEDGEEKYSASVLIPKSDKNSIRKVNAAIDAAKELAKAKNGGKLPAKFKLPLRDGDEDRPDDKAYAGHYFLNANARTKPGVVDKDLNPILDQDEFYSGCYGFVSITFFPFDVKGNRGIGCGLNNVMKTKDGEPLGGRVSAETDFGGITVEDDDDFLD